MANAQLISVVDDDERVRQSLGSLLRSVGYDVKLFQSAEDFLDRRALDARGCLILDVRMPGMSGVELYGHLAKGDFDLPVIFISAHEFEQALAPRTRRLPVIAWLMKPFSEDLLLKAVADALSVNQRRHPESATNYE